MGIDIRSSRRTRFLRCTYYSNKATKQEILERDTDKLGIFYADEVNGESNAKQDMGGFIRRSIDTLAIVTDDDVDIKTDYWVQINADLYIVTGVQKVDITKTRQFSTRPQTKTTLQLRK